MKRQKQLEFANLVVKFGPSMNLLDLGVEVVLPAFLDGNMVRKYGDSRYFFYGTQLLQMTENDPPVLVIAGRLVKDTVLEREQIFDKEKGLVREEATLASAPSAFFALRLNDHKLVYLKETVGAPNIGTFGTTVDRFLKERHRRFVRSVHEKEVDVSPYGLDPESTTPYETLWKRFPLPRADLIPLASEASLEQFVRNYKVLTKVSFRFIQTNDEIDLNDFFGEVRSSGEDVGSRSTVLSHSSPQGLAIEPATVQLRAAAEQGNTYIHMVGKDEQGADLRGTNDDFKLKFPGEDIGGSIGEMAKKALDVLAHVAKQGLVKITEPSPEAMDKVRQLWKALQG